MPAHVVGRAFWQTALAVLVSAACSASWAAERTPSAAQPTPLAYREAQWYGSTFWTGPDWTRVGKDWHHPGQNTPSVRRFNAPHDGSVTITGRVFKLHLGGDGVCVSIRHNDREVWKAEIEGADDKGVEPKLTLDVKKGDALRFVVDKRGNIGCDTTGWDPAITYLDGERFQASTAFATKKQGAGNWFYEMLGQGKPAAAKSPLLGPESFPEPPTVALPHAAAEELLVKDWLAQRGTKPTGDACQEELARAERILKRLSKRLDAATLAKWQNVVAQWRGRLGGMAGEELYLGLRRMKRELLLADPEIDFNRILCIDNPYVHGSEAIHEIRHRNEDTATPGGRLLLLDGLGPDAGVRKLAPQGVPAAFWRPDLSFDGKKVLFCMKSADQSAYHLYEVDLDGTGWRQITEGDYNDLDPIYAPDGGIIFSTSRCNHYLRCGGSKLRMFILARCAYPNPEVKFPTEDTVVPALTAMSHRSRLIELATGGKHYDVRVSPEEEARLVAWVDALCPYLGIEEILAESDITPKDYYDQAVYKGLSHPSKMRTAPIVHKAFCQDDFKTQLDRHPRDAAGNPLPAVEIKDGKRTFRIPSQRTP